MHKKRIIPFIILVFLICGINTTLIIAEVPQVINYQGRLTNSTGYPLDATVQISFTIFDGGGASKWTETHSSVVVSNGLFNVLLGTTNPIPDSVFNHPDRYLGMKVGDDGELTPRTRLTSVPYAVRSSQADTSSYARVAPTPFIAETNTVSGITGSLGPEQGTITVTFDSSFAYSPLLMVTVVLLGPSGGLAKGSVVYAELDVSSDEFTATVYEKLGGPIMSNAAIDVTYMALQIGP